MTQEKLYRGKDLLERMNRLGDEIERLELVTKQVPGYTDGFIIRSMTDMAVLVEASAEKVLPIFEHELGKRIAEYERLKQEFEAL